jgi:hypothetical protein
LTAGVIFKQGIGSAADKPGTVPGFPLFSTGTFTEGLQSMKPTKIPENNLTKYAEETRRLCEEEMLKSVRYGEYFLAHDDAKNGDEDFHQYRKDCEAMNNYLSRRKDAQEKMLKNEYKKSGYPSAETVIDNLKRASLDAKVNSFLAAKRKKPQQEPPKRPQALIGIEMKNIDKSKNHVVAYNEKNINLLLRTSSVKALLPKKIYKNIRKALIAKIANGAVPGVQRVLKNGAILKQLCIENDLFNKMATIS